MSHDVSHHNGAAGRTPTAFEQRVYDLLMTIPRGQVSTYAAMARALSCRSPQAVGQALRRNPFAPAVPCHRVVSSELTLHGFNGHTDEEELGRKRRLLEAEGVRFRPDGRVAPECLVYLGSDEGGLL